MLWTPPPSYVADPPVIVRPEIVAVTPLATSNTPKACPPLIDTTPAPVPSITSGPDSLGERQRGAQGDRLRRGRGEDHGIELDLAAGGVGIGVGQGEHVGQRALTVVRPHVLLPASSSP